MTTLVREPNAKPVGQLVIPYKGTWRSIAANMLSTDQLYDSLNVFIRAGRLRDRPGLTLLNNTTFEHDVIGGIMAVTPFTKVMLAFTYNKLYRLNHGSFEWSIDTVSAIGSGNTTMIDLTFLETASQYVCIIANNETALKKWIDGSGVTVITATSGVVPIAKSVCTASSRIVALLDNHTLRWTDTLTYDVWNPLSYNKKPAETNDAGICVRALNSLDFVVYKERSIYYAKAQAGASARAFSVGLVQEVEGPAGVHAVVKANGVHVYMTRNGRIGLFDGTSYVRWIADGLWLFIQNDIDPVYASQLFGVFDYRLHTVTFYYPKRGDDGALKAMVTINIPLEGSGIVDFACFLGYTNKAMSYGYEMRFDDTIDRSVLFTSGVQQARSYLYDETINTDDDVAFDCMMQTGLLPMPDMKHHQVSAEMFIERAMGNGSVDVRLITSDVLETDTGTIEALPSHTLGLEFNPVREYLGFNLPTRFVGIKMNWSSLSTVRYIGAVIYGREVS